MSDHYEYSTAEISKFYGLTPKGLAYYEKQGIIAPKRDENSSYRIYSLDDCYCMYHSKLYRNNGLTIKNTADLLQCKEIDEITEMIERQQREEERQMMIHALVMEKTKWILSLLQ